MKKSFYLAHQTLLWIINESSKRCFWSIVFKRGTHFEQSFCVSKYLYKNDTHDVLIFLRCQLLHALSRFLIWAPRGFGTTTFELSKLSTNGWVRRSRFLVTLFEYFLSFNFISSHQIMLSYQRTKFVLFHYFEIIIRCVTKTSVYRWLGVEISSNCNRYRLRVGIN